MTGPARIPAAESRAGLGRLLGGVMWNAAGRGLPLLLALVLTPFLVHALGLERWGLFTLALAMVGVFGIFDLGIGPALTRAVSERLGTGREQEAPALVGAALTALAGFSAVIAAAGYLAMPSIADGLLNIPPALRDEAVLALRVLVLAAPLVVVNGALWGVLAAYQRFRAANLATIPVSIMYYLGPVLVLLVWDSLVAVMLTLVACRLVNTLSYAWLARQELRGLRLGRFDLALVGPLLRMGGWMTLSNTLTQALLYADRFLIGALLTLSAVAFYATPLDLVLRMWILPVAVAQALMPALASTHAALPVQTAALLRRGALLIMLLVFPACLLVVAGAEEILRLWLGAEFAAGGGTVLRILGVGIFFSCVAYAPGCLLDAIGRPDVTARLALAQAALFLPLSAAMLLWQGIEGAAIAWALRAAADCALRLVFAARLYPPARAALRGLAPALGVAALGLAALVPLHSVPLVAGAGLLALAAFLAAALLALEPGERALLRRPSGLRALLRPEPGA